MTNIIQKNDRAKRKRLINKREFDVTVSDDVKQKCFLAFREAVLLYLDEVNQTPVQNRARGFAANLFNSKMLQCLDNYFPDEHVKGKYGRHVFFIEGCVLLIKKLNRYDYPMCLKTKSVTGINNQESRDLFGDLDDEMAPIIFFGYKTTDFGQIVDPKFVYIDDGKVQWCYSEAEFKEKTAPTFMPLFSIEEPKEIKLALKEKGASESV